MVTYQLYNTLNKLVEQSMGASPLINADYYGAVATGENGELEYKDTYPEAPVITFESAGITPITKLMVYIEPVQSGSGDPSPDNIRPISGWDIVETMRTGINIWDEIWEPGIIDNSTGLPVPDNVNIRSKNYIPIIPDIRLFFYNGSNTNLRYYFYDENKNFISSSVVLNGGRRAPLNAYWLKIRTTSAYGNIYKHDISINYPSTETAYHPYTGSIITTELPSAVYGGVLDLISGELTVDRAMIASYAGETLPGEWISDRDVYSAGATPTTGAQVVYMLDTPTVYTLTTEQVKTLVGTNTILSNAGNVSVTKISLIKE